MHDTGTSYLARSQMLMGSTSASHQLINPAFCSAVGARTWFSDRLHNRTNQKQPANGSQANSRTDVQSRYLPGFVSVNAAHNKPLSNDGCDSKCQKSGDMTELFEQKAC